MSSSIRLCVLLLLTLLPRQTFSAEAKPPPVFELKDGDVVAIIGDAFAEREQVWSFLETRLLVRWPDRTIHFRNLGWSGDTVFGHARAMFDGPAQGMERLFKAVDEVKPTVIFVCYGMSESFDGESGLPTFREGLGDMLKNLEKPGVRIVLVSPIKHEKCPPPLPDPEAHNASLRLYVDAIRDIANQRGHRFVNLFDGMDNSPGERLTENGIHLNEWGYWVATGAIEKELGLAPLKRPMELDRAGGKVQVEERNDAAEKLRQTAIAKNVQYFNQYRPQNYTYIFGFRKHEQGQNAVEMPRFDKPIAEYETEITGLARDAGGKAN